MVTQLFCPCHHRNESFLASWLWLLLWLLLQYQAVGSSTASNFSLKFSYVSSTSCSQLMLCLTGRRKKYPLKILGGQILGGYIYRYTPVATPLATAWERCLSVKQLDCEKTQVLERFMLRLYFVCFYNVPVNKTNVINLLLGLLCAFMTISWMFLECSLCVSCMYLFS